MRIVVGVVVVLCLGLVGYGAYCSAMSSKGVDKLYEEVQRKKETEGMLMATLTTTWKTANGVQHTVTTTQRAGETPTAFAARHRDLVTAAQLIYPPA